MVVVDGINIQPRVEVVHNAKENLSQDNSVFKPCRAHTHRAKITSC
jgi:hypothetical protein